MAMLTDLRDSLINYTKKEPKDFMVPSIWGYVRCFHALDYCRFNANMLHTACERRRSVRTSTIGRVLFSNVTERRDMISMWLVFISRRLFGDLIHLAQLYPLRSPVHLFSSA
jgi:hypothetical protein